MNQQDRAVTPVIAIILMVAVLIVLAATISVSFFGVVEDVNEPAPNLAETTGELEPVDGGDGGIITITHLGGDSVEVENMEIVVDATDACGKRSRVVNLPASFSGQSYPNNQLDDKNFEGDDLLAQGALPWIGQEEWDARLLMDTDDNTFSAGDSFQLRIGSGNCDLESGDQVNLDIIHMPSSSIIIDEEFTI